MVLASTLSRTPASRNPVLDAPEAATDDTAYEQAVPARPQPTIRRASPSEGNERGPSEGDETWTATSGVPLGRGELH